MYKEKGFNPESVLSKKEELKELLERHKAEWDVVENVVDYGDGRRKYKRAGLLSIPEFKRTSLRNAKFRVVYWNAKYNREVYF